MYDLRNNLPFLYDFYLVAKSKSYTKAAGINNVSQPSLSRSIKLLEENMKMKLVNRNNKGVELTNDGEELFKHLDTMFNTFNDYNKNNLNDSTDLIGKITIGTTRNIADNRLSHYLSIFNSLYPNVKIKIITDSASNLNNYLLNHKIDVLIDYVPNLNFTEKDNMEIKQIGNFDTCFACSKGFYSKYGDKIKTFNDLTKYKLVISGASRRRQMLDEVLTSININLDPKIEMPDSKLMADFVKENEYIGYFVKEEVETFDLVALKLDFEMPKNYIGIIYSKNTTNLITKKFIELVLENK